MKVEGVEKKRIAKFIDFLMEMDDMENEYEIMAEELVGLYRSNLQCFPYDYFCPKIKWTEAACGRLRDFNFPNNLASVQKLYTQFKHYRTVERPPKVADKGNLEAHLFNIQTQLFSQSRPMYLPPNGLLISDINNLWEKLETIESARERALRDDLIRLGKLEQLASKFARKANLRETWLQDNEDIIQQDVPGETLASVRVKIKRIQSV